MNYEILLAIMIISGCYTPNTVYIHQGTQCTQTENFIYREACLPVNINTCQEMTRMTRIWTRARMMTWWRTAMIIPYTQKISFEKFTVVKINNKIDSYFLNNSIPLNEFEETKCSWDNNHSMINKKERPLSSPISTRAQKRKVFFEFLE